MSRSDRRLVSLVALSLLAVPAARAQVPYRLEPGRFVRVTVEPGASYEAIGRELPLGARHEGTFLGLSGDSVRFRPSAQSASAVTLPPAAIRRIEVPGKRHSNALTGFLTGAGIGFVVGAVAGGTCDDSMICSPGFGSAMAGGALVGGLFGVVGAAVGALSHSQGWDSVPLDALVSGDGEPGQP